MSRPPGGTQAVGGRLIGRFALNNRDNRSRSASYHVPSCGADARAAVPGARRSPRADSTHPTDNYRRLADIVKKIRGIRTLIPQRRNGVQTEAGAKIRAVDVPQLKI